MVRRPIFRGRSLWLRLLHLGRPPRAANGGAQELHRVQGPHAQASRRRARGRGREDQGLIAPRPSANTRCSPLPRGSGERVEIAARAESISHERALLRCVRSFTLRPADALYRGDVTERSVMAVGGHLPPPLLGVSSLNLAPLAFSRRAFFIASGFGSRLVMPGLDPGIHRKEALHSRMMDCRVVSAFTRVFRRAMPGNDGG